MSRQKGQTLVEFALVLGAVLMVSLAIFSASLVWTRWGAARVGAYSLCEFIADTAVVPVEWASALVVDIPVPMFTLRRHTFRPADGTVDIFLITQNGQSSPYASFRAANYTVPSRGVFAGYRLSAQQVRPVDQVQAVECRLSASLGVDVPLLGRLGLDQNEVFVVRTRWH